MHAFTLATASTEVTCDKRRGLHANIHLLHVSHHGAAVGPPEVPLEHPVVEADPLVIAAQPCRHRPDVRPLPGDGWTVRSTTVLW